MWILRTVLLCGVVSIAVSHESNSQDEDDINYFLGKLYEEATDDVDPFDMLAMPGQKKNVDVQKPKAVSGFGSGKWTADSDQKTDASTCSSGKGESVAAEQEKLRQCQEEVKDLQQAVEAGRKQIDALGKLVRKEGSMDMKAFYKRAVQHIWRSLNLEEAEAVLKDEEDSSIVRQLTTVLKKEQLMVLRTYIQQEKDVLKVDQILHDMFKLETTPMTNTHGFFAKSFDWISSVFESGKNVETWLYVLCIGFIFLGLWAVVLFIRDIQRELRWTRVIYMMIFIIFFICCLWHWRHMHKVAEVRRHAQMVKRGYNEIPEECKPGAKGTAGNAWDWIRVRVFGAADVCEKYFEELMIDPLQEITPGMVIAETLSKFFFQPLQHLGSESAKFINNFYSTIPVMYHVPATVFFLVLLIILLFAFCGYGIDFPLWLGGIRPIYRTETADTSEVDRITKEAIAQMKEDREKFMAESRMMLTSISQATMSPQVQGLNPVMALSSGILEAKLEHLIETRISSVLSREAITRPEPAPLRQEGGAALDTSGVYTITSTPLRRDSSEDDTNVSVISSPSAGQGTRPPTGTRPKALKFRPNSVSSTSSVWSQDSSRIKRNPQINYETIEYEEESAMALEEGEEGPVNLTRSPVSNDDHPQNSPSRSKSCNVCNKECDVDEVDHETSVAEESFLDQVKKVLEESVGSSHNNSSILLADVSARSPEDISDDQKLEMSSSSVPFLKEIKEIMTP